MSQRRKFSLGTSLLLTACAMLAARCASNDEEGTRSDALDGGSSQGGPLQDDECVWNEGDGCVAARQVEGWECCAVGVSPYTVDLARGCRQRVPNASLEIWCFASSRRIFACDEIGSSTACLVPEDAPDGSTVVEVFEAGSSAPEVYMRPAFGLVHCEEPLWEIALFGEMCGDASGL